MRFARAAVLAAALTALLAPTTAQAAPAGHATPAAAPGDTVTLPVQEALAQLPVRLEDRTGYVRTAFKHWVDADKDGCNTRAEVLKAEAVIPPDQINRCSLVGGAWYSPYDDRYIEGAPPAWTSTTWSRSPRPGTPAPPPGARRNARPTPTTSATTAP